MDTAGCGPAGAGRLKNKFRWLLLGLGFAGAAACLLLDGSWDTNRRMAAALLVLAATLWFTEVVPPFATAFLVIFLRSFFLFLRFCLISSSSFSFSSVVLFLTSS